MNLKTVKGVKQIGILIIFVLTVVGGLLIAQPFLMQNTKLAEDIKTSEESKSSAASKLSSMEKAKSNLPGVSKIDKDLSVQFPPAAQTPELISFVQQAAVSSGMSPSAITDLATTLPKLETAATGADPAAAAPAADPAAAAPADPAAAAGAAPPTSGGNLASMGVTIKADGSVDQLQKFVTNLNSGSRNLLISAYTIDKGSAEGGGFTLQVTATTYIYKSIPQPPAN